MPTYAPFSMTMPFGLLETAPVGIPGDAGAVTGQAGEGDGR